MIQQQIYDSSEVLLSSSEPLLTYQLALIADEIRDNLALYRPEFTNLANLHRNAGCRVKELFEPDRWKVIGTNTLQIQPQKGNALRVIPLSDLGYTSSGQFEIVLDDIARLPLRQYERAFTEMVQAAGLWRLYEDGFARPGTHLFRHVKIKELSLQGYDNSYIATWIGEKNVQNLDYYLFSQFFV